MENVSSKLTMRIIVPIDVLPWGGWKSSSRRYKSCLIIITPRVSTGLVVVCLCFSLTLRFLCQDGWSPVIFTSRAQCRVSDQAVVFGPFYSNFSPVLFGCHGVSLWLSDFSPFSRHYLSCYAFPGCKSTIISSIVVRIDIHFLVELPSLLRLSYECGQSLHPWSITEFGLIITV